MNDREIETLGFLIVANAAFVKDPLMLKHISLAGLTLAKAVEHRFGNRVLTVGDRIDAAVSFAYDLVVIRTIAKAHSRVSFQNSTTFDRFQRAAHRICRALAC